MNVEVFTKGRLNKYEASGVFDGKGLTIKKGSLVSDKLAENVNPIVKKMREKVLNSDFTTKEDVSFKSPSTAAAFVTGNVSNGFRVWKVEQGVDLGTYKERMNG